MNKQILKINFSDFWKGFNKTNNLFFNLLKHHFQLEISEDPDILFYSCFGYHFLNYKCHRIFYTGENIKPNYYDCDFSLTFYHEDFNNRNFRLPLYLFSNLKSVIDLPKDPEKIAKTKNKFCNMVVSNEKCKARNNFYHLLNGIKKVDSGGRYLNNVGGPVKDKLAFISDYKFTLAFENKSTPGYVTEKLIEPMRVNSIPIYWGNTKVNLDFNEKSFINAHRFKTFDELAKYIIEVDNDNNLYKQILAEPYLIHPTPPFQEYQFLSDQFRLIVNTLLKKEPVAKVVVKTTLSNLSNISKRVMSKLNGTKYWSV